MDAAPGPSVAQAWLARSILPVGLATPALAPWVWPLSPPLAVALVVGSHLPLFYGTFLANRQIFGPVVTGFRGGPDEVWVTIDDGPDPHDTPRILDALGAAGARATFFVRGDRARAHPELIREIVARGHCLGNHTFSHPQRTFWGLPPWRIADEMDRCNAALIEITGVTPTLFRAPVGMINPFVHHAAHARGMQVIGWSARAYDAGRVPLKPDLVVSRLLRQLRPGGIVLLHEGIGTAGENVQRLLERFARRRWQSVVPGDGSLRPR